MPELRKREIAYKLKIGDILRGSPIIDIGQADSEDSMPKEKFRFLELEGKKIIRVNIIANIIEKYVSETDKRFATLTIDDASGQIRLKVFGDDIKKFEALNQGDTILTIGLLRSFNKELYILPDIIKKTDPRYLLVRKLELEKNMPKQTASQTEHKMGVREQIISLIKESEAEGGLDTEQIILKIREAAPEVINSEIIKLLEDGTIYEPRPGKVRWLG